MNPFSALPSKNAPLLILFIFSLIGMGMLYYATHLGIGISPDSVAYIMASRQLSQGQGLTLIGAHGGQVPLTHFPPLYPLVLSFLSLFGLKIANRCTLSPNLLFWGQSLPYWIHSLLLYALYFNSPHGLRVLFTFFGYDSFPLYGSI